MSDREQINLDWTSCVTDSTAASEQPAGPWRANRGVTAGRGMLEFRCKIGNYNVAVGIQFANDVRSPDAGIAVSRHAAGEYQSKAASWFDPVGVAADTTPFYHQPGGGWPGPGGAGQHEVPFP